MAGNWVGRRAGGGLAIRLAPLAMAGGSLLALLLAAGPAGALPDLQVAVTAAANVTDGGPVTLTVTLSNTGDQASSNASVVLAIDGNPTDPPFEFAPLGAGASASQTPSFTLSCGRHALRAEADPVGAVAEASEANNNATATAAVVPFANFTSSLGGEEGAYTLTLNSSNSRGCHPLGYAWSVAGVGDFTGQQVSLAAPAGNLTVNLTAASLGDATLSSRVSRVVVVPNHPPIVTASLPFSSIRTGARVALAVTAFDPDGDVARYEIDLGDGNVTGDLFNASNHRYERPGSYLIVVRAFDNLGAVNGSEFPLTVLNRPPEARVGEPYAYVDVGQDVSFNASASLDPEGGPLTFSWDFGDGARATGPRASHAYAAPGVYNAVLNVSDADGDSAALTVRVTVLSRTSGPATPQTVLTLGILASVAVFGAVYIWFRRRPPPQQRALSGAVPPAQGKSSPSPPPPKVAREVPPGKGPGAGGSAGEKPPAP